MGSWIGFLNFGISYMDGAVFSVDESQQKKTHPPAVLAGGCVCFCHIGNAAGAVYFLCLPR